MNYRYSTKKEIDRLFDETDLTVGEIIHTIVREKYTGIKISNRSKIRSMSDEDWYESIEKAARDEQE